MFTVDYTDSHISDDPAQHKQSHVIELLDAGDWTGNIVALPNNRVRVTNPALWACGDGAPDFAPSQWVLSAEGDFSYMDAENTFNNLYAEDYWNGDEEVQDGNQEKDGSRQKDKNVYDMILESAQNLSRSGVSSFNPDKFLNNGKDRAKSIVDKGLVSVQQKKARKDEELLTRKKKEIDYQRLNILENIQSQKDEQKSKDKT